MGGRRRKRLRGDTSPQSHEETRQYKEEGKDPHSITTLRGEHVKEAVSPSPSMNNPQEETRARIVALEEKRRRLVQDRDQIMVDIRAREKGNPHLDESLRQLQGHDNRFLTYLNGVIEGEETSLSIIYGPGLGYPSTPTGATSPSRTSSTGASGGSSMSSNSLAEAATTNIFTRGGGIKYEAPQPQEAACANEVIPSARSYLVGWSTTPINCSTGHGSQGGLQSTGTTAASAQARAPSWQAAQPTGLSTSNTFSALQREFQRGALGTGSSGAGHQQAGASGMILQPGSEEAELATRLGADGGGLHWAPQLGPRQVIVSPRQHSRSSCDSPCSSAGAVGAWEDKEGSGRRASEVDDEDRLLAPHVNLDSVMVSPALIGSLDAGPAKPE